MVVHRGGFHGHVDEELAGLQGDDIGLGRFLDDCPRWLGQIGLSPPTPSELKGGPSSLQTVLSQSERRYCLRISMLTEMATLGEDLSFFKYSHYKTYLFFFKK